MKHCNARGCSPWDCDNCRTSRECDKTVICDICGGECDEYYYRIDGDDYCIDCLNDEFREQIYG